MADPPWHIDFFRYLQNIFAEKFADLEAYLLADEAGEFLMTLAEIQIFPVTEKLNKIVNILNILQEMKVWLKMQGELEIQEFRLQYVNNGRKILEMILYLFRNGDPCLLSLICDSCMPRTVEILLNVSRDVHFTIKGNYQFSDLVLSALIHFDYRTFRRRCYSISIEKRTLLNFIVNFGTTFSPKPENNDFSCIPLHSFLAVDLLLLYLHTYNVNFASADNRNPFAKLAVDLPLTYISFMLPSLPPICLSDYQERCEEMDIDFNSILTAVDRASTIIPQLPQIVSRETCTLKHICRIVIRNQLFSCFELPDGIDDLKMPNYLKQYLKLETN